MPSRLNLHRRNRVAKALYNGLLAQTLGEREAQRGRYENEKLGILLGLIGRPASLLDLGCGSGLLLHAMQGKVGRLAGLDESRDRIRQAKENCRGAEYILSKIEDMCFEGEFEVIVASQVMHELKLFAPKKVLGQAIMKVREALVPDGRFIFLDHLDPGAGDCEISVGSKTTHVQLNKFQREFRYRTVRVQKLYPELKIKRRDLQDFVTKTWSFGTNMESMEMRETHCCFTYDQVMTQLKKCGLETRLFKEFQNIESDLNDHDIRLMRARPWNRKFVSVSYIKNGQ